LGVVQAASARIASLSPHEHVPSQETQEHLMYGTSMLGLLAEHHECRALIGQQPDLVELLASLIQVRHIVLDSNMKGIDRGTVPGRLYLGM